MFRSKKYSRLSSQAKQKLAAITLPIAMLILSACGVKGDPRPPGTPAEIGRGKPSMRTTNDSIFKPSQKKIKNEDQEEPGFEE